MRQIGAAYGTVVNQRAPLEIATLTFLVAFIISCGALAGLIYLRWRRLAGEGSGQEHSPRQGNGASPEGAQQGRRPTIEALRRTTAGRTPIGRCRGLAGFIALLWLIPFNSLVLNVSFPIDLSLDRLLLPLVAAAWVLAFVGRSSFIRACG